MSNAIISGNNLVFQSQTRLYSPRSAPIKVSIDRQSCTYADLPSGFTGLTIATPCYGASAPLDFMTSLMNLALACKDEGFPSEIIILPGDSLITRARNALSAVFLASTHSHLLFIDADCGFEKDDALRLLAADKDMIGGVCPRKTEYPSFSVNFLPGKEIDVETGTLEIEGCGMAFMLIKRAVFERIAEADPSLKVKGPGYLSPEEQACHRAFFDCQIADGGYWSEDLVFCKRWRACGGRIHVIPDIKLRHSGAKIHAGRLSDALKTD